jgi:murein DD-endopeptidase MepM/ murein hydrolase activator NlpD
VVSQGNCTTGGHRGRYKHSFDFAMPIGTVVTAARAGTVTFVEERFGDDTTTIAENNFIVLRHNDGLFTAYSHLTPDGALVEVGDVVAAGDPIARSGNSGYTGGFPHLHFHLETCGTCFTAPITFRNTLANPNGLQQGESYPALE